MKYNLFGEPQPESDDDLAAAFEERYGDSSDLEVIDYGDETVEYAEHLGGWCCSVINANGDELTVRGFDSKEALIAYLEKHDVEGLNAIG
jgi:hypothetical protein